MSDSYTNLLYHIVFSTKDRRPLITSQCETQLYNYIGGTIRGLGGISLELNGTEDHVHVLCKLRPIAPCQTCCANSKQMRRGGCMMSFPSSRISHGNGYGAFTVSQSKVDDVRRYISRQKEHQAKVSFRDEFIQFLKDNGIDYDERYV